NSSLFLNEYEETDGTSSRFGGYNIELGGNLSSGGGIDTLYGSKNWYRAEQGQMQPENLKVQSTVSNQTVAMLTPGDEAGAILGFGAADETLNTGSGGTTYNVRTPAYRLRYYPVSSDPYSGWYGFEYGTNLSKVPFLFSGANAGDGSGKMWMPFGFYLGYQGSPARHTIGVDPEGLTVDGAKLPSVKALIKEVTGDYSLTPADIGYTIFVDSAADVTLSVPAGLGKAARFTIIRKGPGNVSIIPKQGGGVVIGQADGYSRLRNRYSVAELVADRENVFVLYGDLKP
ncbi:MAG: hypothetical protein JO053_00975, partial [Acidobacteria bacterium]|nr:hypothetical protein [Acidobacteriota bacterium]